MLKITIADDAESFGVHLHGRFTSEYVAEVQKALFAQTTDTQKIVLDLANVTFVDREAMKFLCAAKSKHLAMENIS